MRKWRVDKDFTFTEIQEHILPTKEQGKWMNVYVGEFAKIFGAQKLTNGTILSHKKNPTYIGRGVIADGFIIQQDSVVDNFSMIENCFVGQACKIDKHFYAENSLIFSNSECMLGEACSAILGPYSVSHHKSTLLIAGYFSFYNAGSGTNQSNHLYKLGPVHQGIVERGSKTGRSSYLMWPSKVGPFTSIIGKHTNHLDSGDFHFSYIISKNESSIIIPSINIKNIGAFRDNLKWKSRDKRKAEHVDYIISDVFNPYIVNKILQAIDELSNIQEKGPKSEFVHVHNLKLKVNYIKHAIRNYSDAVIMYCGNIVLNKFELLKWDFNKLAIAFNVDGLNYRKWHDIGGLIAPDNKIQEIILQLKEGIIASVDQLNQQFSSLP
jgi:hypothetical protein